MAFGSSLLGQLMTQDGESFFGSLVGRKERADGTAAAAGSAQHGFEPNVCWCSEAQSSSGAWFWWLWAASVSALQATEYERAQAGTIRLKLLKLGAIVRVSVRRIVLSIRAPARDAFHRIAALLEANVPFFG